MSHRSRLGLLGALFALTAGCPGPTGGPRGARPTGAKGPGARDGAAATVRPARRHPAQPHLDRGFRALRVRPTPDYAACLAAFGAVLERDRAHRVARLNQAWCALRLGRLATAETAYRAAKPRQDRRALLGLLDVLARRGRWKDALPLASAWLTSHPKDRVVLTFTAEILRRLGQPARALKRVQQALAVDRRDAAAHVQFGRLYLARKDARTALMILNRGLRYHPKHARLLFTRGQARWALGEMGKAVMDYEAALRQAPGFVAARLHLGKVYVDNLDYKGALGHFQAVLQRWPRHREARLGQARALFGLKRFKPALQAYQRVLKAARAHPGALFQIAKIHQDHLDQPRQALIYYRRFLRARPGLPKGDPVFATIKMLEAMTRAVRRPPPVRRRRPGGSPK